MLAPIGEPPDVGGRSDPAVILALDTPIAGTLTAGSGTTDRFVATLVQDGVLDALLGAGGRDSFDLGLDDGVRDLVNVETAASSRTDSHMDVNANFVSGLDCIDFQTIDPDTTQVGDRLQAWGGTTTTDGGL